MTKREYCTGRPCAYYSGWGGLEIYHIEYTPDGDYIYYTSNAWSGKPVYHKSVLYYRDDDVYFKYHGVRIHLNECIRNN